MDHYLFVTIILPIRNEARHIARCLDAILAQDYAPDQIEILAMDGMSNDGTREIVARYAAQFPRLRLVDNPQRIVSTGLNRGIRLARGSVIVRVDGHTVIASDYVTRCVEALCATKADNVGGPMRAFGETRVAQAISLASSSRFGVGNALFHYAEKPGWVDTVYLGAYRAEVFDRIGMFDEELVRNQDDEFNYRLVRASGRIWLDPQVRSVYFSRATLHGLCKQYWEYGYWKVRVIQKHGRPASWRHLAPAAFVLALIASTGLGIVFASPPLSLAVLAPYAIASLTASLWIAVHKGFQYLPLLPLAFAAMHISYGMGFLAGLVNFKLNPSRNAILVHAIDVAQNVDSLSAHTPEKS